MSTLAHTGHEPLALGRRARQAMRSLAYLLAGLALGVLYLIALPTALLGGATALRRLLEFERTLANRLFAARIPALRPIMPGEPIERRQVAFLASRLPLYALAAALCAIPAALVVELLLHAVEGFVGSSSYLGPWSLGPAVGFVLLLFSLPALVLLAATLIACASQLAQQTRRGLTSRASTGVAVREALAERLGDRTLAIAYWLPERELFVDEHGYRSRTAERRFRSRLDSGRARRSPGRRDHPRRRARGPTRTGRGGRRRRGARTRKRAVESRPPRPA